ncbi:hypothetical protein Acr_14g0000630 [Actinidia rufa]|uniref:Uncharacterized protein n=1 Tax=Actinidia rufa TaxID=165716 RepID=A0A7J0FPV4_9ERIC|nr:hypothetical protein Acr_14g0000630 [Actinidia rufa]
MAQILVDNRLMKLAQAAKGGPPEDISKRSNLQPQEGPIRRQRRSHVNMDSRSDSKSVASSKRRTSPSQAYSSMDLRETLNTKQNREGGLRAKLNN